MAKHRFRIWQYVGADEIVVAAAVCPDNDSMLREMNHYATLYAEEGSIRIETRANDGKWKRHIP